VVESTNRIAVDDVPDQTRAVFDLFVAHTADGAKLAVPVHVLAGSGEGSCLAIVAGVHGDEAEGISALYEMSRTLDLASFRGRLLLVPIANPLAFGANQRRTPADGVDLNRIFPGKPGGTVSEQLAHRIFELVRSNAYFLLTLHGWYATGDTLPHVEVSDIASAFRKTTYEAAFASGFEFVRAVHWHPGLLPAAINAVGIPSMEAELGGGGYTRRAFREQYSAHILALMRHLGMRDGKDDLPSRKREVWVSEHVVPSCGGVMISDIPLGAKVRSGEVLGIVTDLHGVSVEHLKAPFDGVLMARRNFISIMPGDLAFTVFKPAPHIQID
jgi:predicted deacylase